MKISGFEMVVVKRTDLYQVRRYSSGSFNILISEGKTEEEAIYNAIAQFCDNAEVHRLYHMMGVQCPCTMIKVNG